MKRAGHLFERVVDFHGLCRAARRAARGKRLSQQAADFLLNLEPEVLQLERELLAGVYEPRPYRTFRIRDPKPRLISAAAFRDRVVHHALCAALEPVFERAATGDSFACRPGRGQHAALARVRRETRRHPWFVKLDVEHFFETADHGVLRRLLRRHLKDRRLLALCDRFIDAGCPGSPPGKGMPIGNLTSQHFANFYLSPLDHFVRRTLRAPAYVRYMDDMLCFGPDKVAVRQWRDGVEAFAARELSLRLRPDAERLGPVRVGVPFLGFRVWPGLVRFDAARARRLRRRLRGLSRVADDDERARRVQSVVGWAAQGDTARLRASVLRRIEADAYAGGGEG